VNKYAFSSSNPLTHVTYCYDCGEVNNSDKCHCHIFADRIHQIGFDLAAQPDSTTMRPLPIGRDAGMVRNE